MEPNHNLDGLAYLDPQRSVDRFGLSLFPPTFETFAPAKGVPCPTQRDQPGQKRLPVVERIEQCRKLPRRLYPTVRPLCR